MKIGVPRMCLTMRAVDLVVGRAKIEESKRTLFSVSLVGSPTKPLTRAVGRQGVKAMVVKELIDLFEIARKLASRKAELDKNYFDEFIQPLWDKFVEIHEDYKATFQEYTRMAVDNNQNVSSIIERLYQDSLYSDNLRSELRSMVNNTPSAFPKTSNQHLDEFLTALSYYFELRASFKITQEKDGVKKIYAPRMSNSARRRVMITLSRKGDSSNKDEVLKVLRDTMRMLQSNYEWVSKSFYSLKKDILR